MGHFWENVAQYSIPAVAALVGVWLSGRRTDRKVEEVRDLAEPTGNGFAMKVKDSLERLEEGQKEIRADVRILRSDLSDHLHDHSIAPRPQVPRQRLQAAEEPPEGRAG